MTWKLAAALLPLVVVIAVVTWRHAPDRPASQDVKLVRPNIARAKAALDVGGIVECWRFGDYALNCFVTDSQNRSCRVVGVQQNSAGKIRLTKPYGIVICSTIANERRPKS